MNDMAIDVRNLTKMFGTFKAVDDISFTVRRGEIFGFLGANGAGKSTTIRMLCGLLRSSGGTAIVGGYDINAETEALKSAIGYMSQKFSLYEDLTVEQNVRFFGGVYGLEGRKLEDRMSWVLKTAGLLGRERSLTGTLPGGYKQRLALGCAILHEPRILFLDEPTGGVDPVSRRSFWDLIYQLSSQGVTVLVTTHFLDEAEYCNEIILINAGRLIAGGSPLELKTQHIKHIILEVNTNNTVEALEVIREQPWTLEATVFGTRLHVMVRDEEEGRRMIVRTLREKNLIVAVPERIVPSLEDVFLYLLDASQKPGGTGAQAS